MCVPIGKLLPLIASIYDSMSSHVRDTTIDAAAAELSASGICTSVTSRCVVRFAASGPLRYAVALSMYSRCPKSACSVAGRSMGSDMLNGYSYVPLRSSNHSAAGALPGAAGSTASAVGGRVGMRRPSRNPLSGFFLPVPFGVRAASAACASECRSRPMSSRRVSNAPLPRVCGPGSGIDSGWIDSGIRSSAMGVPSVERKMLVLSRSKGTCSATSIRFCPIPV